MTTKHLDNVCIVQKYYDSDKVLECREQFEASKTFIETACNSHDELIKKAKDGLIREHELMTVNDELVEALDSLQACAGGVLNNDAVSHSRYSDLQDAIKRAKEALRKASAL